jgi:serine/threonine protein kinase
MSYFSVSDCQEYGTLRTDRTVTIRGHDKNESNPIGTSRIDLISFLSVIMKSNSATAEEKTTMRLLSMHLGSWNMFCKLDMRHGASFSVTLIPRRQLLSKTFVSLGNDNLKTSLFALKTPRLDMGLSSPRNSLLFRSIATEYQILKCKSLKQHDNIITLFGCCWQSLDIYASQPIPSLILEGTQLGDLATFSRSHELTLRERLRLCIHITSGLKAIHSLGIIHGDIKLENVLVFDSNRGYTAKVADFGSALVLSEIELPSRRPLGTILYSPPECFEAGATFGRDEFFRIDIFSLGITLSALLQGDHVLENMKQLGSQLTSLKKDGQLSDWILSVDCDGSVIAEHDDTWEPDATWPIDSVQTDGIIWEKYILLIRGTLAALSNERFGSTDEVLPILRSMLRLQLQNTPQLRNDRGKKRSKSSAVKDTLERWARMSAILGVKKARLAKISGANIQSSTRLHHDEFDAITLSCYPKFCPVDVIRASRLVQKYRAYRKQQTLLSSRWRLIARLPSKRREQGQARNTEIRKAYQYVLKRMKQTLGEW